MQLERIPSLIDSQVPTLAHDGGLGVSEIELAILPSPLSTPLYAPGRWSVWQPYTPSP